MKLHRALLLAAACTSVGAICGAIGVSYFAAAQSGVAREAGVALRARVSELVSRGPSSASPSGPAAVAEGGRTDARHVRLVAPKRGSFTEEVDVAAVVSPRNVSPVHFLVAGKVESCRVKVGDMVRAGQELCRLDASLARLERDRVLQSSQSAERAIDPQFLERQKALYESGVIGQGDWERLRVEAEKAGALRDDARSALSFAEKRIELHSLRAPLAGRVVEMRTRAGLPIAPELPAMVIASSGPGVLKAEIPARHWARVAPGSLMRVASVAGVPLGNKASARLFQATSKAPSVSPEKQTFEVEFSATGTAPIEDLGLAPGMLVSGKLALAEHRNATIVPFAALVSWDSASREGAVFAIGRNGRVIKLEVRTTLPTDGEVHLLGDLPAGARIVHPVPSSLREGDAVEVAP